MNRPRRNHHRRAVDSPTPAPRRVGVGPPTITYDLRPIAKPHDVLRAVLRVYGIAMSDFAARGRSNAVMLARAVYAAACREYTTASWPEIAAAAGQRSHSACLWAARRYARKARGLPMTEGMRLAYERVGVLLLLDHEYPGQSARRARMTGALGFISWPRLRLADGCGGSLVFKPHLPSSCPA